MHNDSNADLVREIDRCLNKDPQLLMVIVVNNNSDR